MDPIESPRDLKLPAPEALQSAIQSLLGTGDARSQFVRMLSVRGLERLAEDLLTSLSEATTTGDLRPVQEVVEAWYRTSQLLRTPGFAEALIDESDDEPISSIERRAILAI